MRQTLFQSYNAISKPSVANGDSLPFVGPQPHSVAALKTPVATGILSHKGKTEKTVFSKL